MFSRALQQGACGSQDCPSRRGQQSQLVNDKLAGVTEPGGLCRHPQTIQRWRVEPSVSPPLELLQGRLSDHVLRVVTDPDRGLFPKPGEITLTCDCPDWAVMCKHAAAVLYGVGSRLDDRPELLFRLRDVDADDLVVGDMALPDAAAGDDVPRRRSARTTARRC